jgi:hypothetical protein
MVKHDPNRTRSKKSVKMILPSENPVLAVFEILARGQLVSQGIFIVAKLRIPDYLSDGGKTVDELANITKTNSNALYRLLRMLASVGIFRETTKVGAGLEQDEQNTVRRFELTPAASLLLSETTNSVREFALLFGLDSFNRATTNLLHAIETGENSFKYANGMDLFEYFQQKQNKTDAEVFDNAMNCLNLSYVSTIFALYDFSQFKTILDIGGGEGVFLSTILKKNPNQLGILFDMPKVIQRAKKKYWTSAAKPLDDHDTSLYSRCKLVKGNFFKTIPSGADCYIIKNVILNWDDESAALILKNCLHAMKKTSLTNLYRPGTQRSHPKLLIIETIMPEGNAPFFGKFTDILMLILTRGGRLRTEAELIKLLSFCGFDIVSITKPPDNVSFLSIVEAIPSEEQR